MFTNNQIEEVLRKNNFKLLGQIEVSDQEYSDLINMISLKVNDMHIKTIPQTDLLLSLALVQVAIRCYQDGRYWACFQKEIGYTIPTNRLTYIGNVFLKTIKDYDLFNPRQYDDGGNQFVEYIKAHAFVTNHYMYGFYDFSYAYFENNLLRQLNEETIDDDLGDLSLFMETTLDNDNDGIQDESNRARRYYRLLKSTRTTFAYCDTYTIRSLFFPVLRLIDNYFYVDCKTKCTIVRLNAPKEVHLLLQSTIYLRHREGCRSR